MHRLGGPLGLPRQLIQLCQRIVGGICLHIRRRACLRRSSIPISHHMTGRLTPRVIRCVRSSVKILRPQTAVGESPRTVLGLRQVTKRHQPCPNKRRKFNSLSEFFGPRSVARRVVRRQLRNHRAGESAPTAAGAPTRPRRAPPAPPARRRSSVSGTPSNTLTTQSLQPGPRTAQSSQSMVTAPVAVLLAQAPGLVHLTVLSIGVSRTVSGTTDISAWQLERCRSQCLPSAHGPAQLRRRRIRAGLTSDRCGTPRSSWSTSRRPAAARPATAATSTPSPRSARSRCAAERCSASWPRWSTPAAASRRRSSN